eukprot:355814-Chlamydomonas_euryale.AAC.4
MRPDDPLLLAARTAGVPNLGPLPPKRKALRAGYVSEALGRRVQIARTRSQPEGQYYRKWIQLGNTCENIAKEALHLQGWRWTRGERAWEG